MIDRSFFMVSAGLGGTSIVSVAGLIIRSCPSLQVWAYFLAVVSAIALGCLLALKNPQVTLLCGLFVFFGVLGVILAGV